jgi:acetyltransferase-like isoleucine patch superfamily enzyme
MNISRGTVTFMDTAVLSRGFSLKQDSGETVFGHNFFCNSNCVIYNNQSIRFGDRIIVGWNCSFRTSDGHTIIYSDGSSNHSKPISIGDHVWISANTHVCKGVEIANDCVIAQGSLVTKPLNLCAALYGGRPAKLIKENVKWEI